MNAEEMNPGYVSGHHRGCALHGIAAHHFNTGLEMLSWLQHMVKKIPMSVDNFPLDANKAFVLAVAGKLRTQFGHTKL